MASVEIAVVSSESSNLQKPPAQETVIDIFSASAYGDFEKLRKFVEQDGASLSSPDGGGYYCIQWAALNSFPEIVQYIVEHGGDVNSADSLKQTALHWAAVRGSVTVADVLLQNGARVEASDVNGFRAVHVAAQYGQTAFLNHLVAKYKADYEAPDNDGRSPLHWAGYKGFTDTVRLLLFRDASQGKQDKEGCTPLHWAAMMGNVEVCAILVHSGTKQELTTVKDKAGNTPFQLASDKGHRQVARFLSSAERAVSSHWKDRIFRDKMTEVGYAPILFCMVILGIILFINSVLGAPNLPKVTAVTGLWGWIAVSLAVASLVLFYRCSRKDPGFIKRPGDTHPGAQDPLINIDLNNSELRIGNWSQLCPTCKIIRPLRSKHCSTCKRCVEQFDHHCPWISNCVGKKNKWDFFVFTLMGTLTSLLGAVIAFQRVWTAPVIATEKNESWIHHVIVQHPGLAAFLGVDMFILLAALSLTIAQATQIAQNITTNEMSNKMRYGYLVSPDGKFRNPYNHGCRKNCAHFVLHGYMYDTEIAWPSLHQVQC